MASGQVHQSDDIFLERRRLMNWHQKPRRCQKKSESNELKASNPGAHNVDEEAGKTADQMSELGRARTISDLESIDQTQNPLVRLGMRL